MQQALEQVGAAELLLERERRLWQVVVHVDELAQLRGMHGGGVEGEAADGAGVALGSQRRRTALSVVVGRAVMSAVTLEQRLCEVLRREALEGATSCGVDEVAGANNQSEAIKSNQKQSKAIRSSPKQSKAVQSSQKQSPAGSTR